MVDIKWWPPRGRPNVSAIHDKQLISNWNLLRYHVIYIWPSPVTSQCTVAEFFVLHIDQVFVANNFRYITLVGNWYEYCCNLLYCNFCPHGVKKYSKAINIIKYARGHIFYAIFGELGVPNEFTWKTYLDGNLYTLPFIPGNIKSKSFEHLTERSTSEKHRQFDLIAMEVSQRRHFFCCWNRVAAIDNSIEQVGNYDKI